jgi:small subunit ribosomal protein S16
MLVIRLARIGKKNFPFFRVVLMEKRKSPKGRAIEVLGSVNPTKKQIALDKDRILHWIGLGAQPSDRVFNILVSQKIITGKKRFKKIRAKKKEETQAEEGSTKQEVGKKEEKPVEKTEEAAKGPTEEKPAEEKPAEEKKEDKKEEGKEEKAEKK